MMDILGEKQLCKWAAKQHILFLICFTDNHLKIEDWWYSNGSSITDSLLSVSNL